MVVDMRSMNSITVAPDQMSASVGGGTLNGDFVAHLDRFELTTPTGNCNGVGYVGWAAGGGYGVLGAKYGAGVDQILGARVVTYRGDIVDTSQEEHKELLRGLFVEPVLGISGIISELRVRIYLHDLCF